MHHVGAVDVFKGVVGAHVFNEQTDNLHVAVVGAEVQRRELLVRRAISPGLKLVQLFLWVGLAEVVLQRVLVDSPEAVRVVLERRKGEQ